MLEIEGADRYRAPIVLEGGAIHVDGEGTVLTTEECLLNPNRNPELSQEQIERVLLDYLGAEKVIWLGAGVFEDETDGHVDNLACFVRPGVGAADLDRRRGRPPARDLARRPRATRSGDRRPRALARGRAPPLPRPAADLSRGGRRASTPPRARSRAAPATAWPPPTSTSTSATRASSIPLLDPRHDEEAAAILRRCFPEREVVGVPAREILLGGGNIHCITQQVPAVEPR